ncbi:type IV pilus modification protein PilV [Halovibrio salipaludis]|uniref:Type IV pilus modification protein PilV n=1 Tax=Halovibrio salipaludis TaxID=2032626 RepID=A0A2A2F2C6_9GAMM|nr:type IV pilus modification protein PilV [Halovibrio salipaludis]PAU79596.1 type IV pilus modification protein PilV [Halovibrio salipaludis]
MNRLTKTREAGFSITEVIVAVLILSIGLLGMVGLQTQAVKQTHGAEKRSIATLHANTVAENYRVNDGAWDESAMNRVVKRHLGDEAGVALTVEDELARIRVSWKSQQNDGNGMNSVTVYTRSQ